MKKTAMLLGLLACVVCLCITQSEQQFDRPEMALAGFCITGIAAHYLAELIAPAKTEKQPTA